MAKISSQRWRAAPVTAIAGFSLFAPAAAGARPVSAFPNANPVVFQVDALLPPLVTPPATAAEPKPVRLAISHREVKLSGAFISLGVRCRGTSGARCKGTLALLSAPGDSRLRAAASYGSAKFDLATGADGTLTLKAPASLRGKLAKKHKLIGKVVVSLTQELGAASAIERRITLVG